MSSSLRQREPLSQVMKGPKDPVGQTMRESSVRNSGENSWVSACARKITSEYGEDGVIAQIMEVIGDGTKWCVEFGAGDGKTGSNIWNLLANEGWSGLLIEASDKLFSRLCQEFKDNCVWRCR